MFTSTSMTGMGVVVYLVSMALPHVGVHLDETQVGNFVNAAITLVSTIMMVWGQLRRPDLIAGIIRR